MKRCFLFKYETKTSKILVEVERIESDVPQDTLPQRKRQLKALEDCAKILRDSINQSIELRRKGEVCNTCGYSIDLEGSCKCGTI